MKGVDHMFRKMALALCIGSAMAASGSEAPGGTAPNSSTTPGLSAEQLAKLPHVLFAHELEDVPNRNIVVSLLDFPPNPAQGTAAVPCSGHRHAGPAYVYVL